jgi:ABC-type bacteriocin/lantibiotic exporter with double-glycine peptidase domain
LKELPAGDATELGENGINLSGGQKARIALARSVYADRDIMLLDDPISALDPKVAKKVFDKVLRGVCRDKTIVLATHAVDYLKLADKIILLDNGRIEAQGSLDDLKDEPLLLEIINEHEESRKKVLEKNKKDDSDSLLSTPVLQRSTTLAQHSSKSLIISTS